MASWTSSRSLIRLTDICCALPEVVRKLNPASANFTVRNRKFAYYLAEHYRYEGTACLVCKVPTGENEALIASEPKRFYMPQYVGAKG